MILKPVRDATRMTRTIFAAIATLLGLFVGTAYLARLMPQRASSGDHRSP